MYWLFGTLVYLDAKLPRPGCRGKGLGLLTGQVPCPLLRRKGEGGGKVGEQEGNGRRGRSVNF